MLKRRVGVKQEGEGGVGRGREGRRGCTFFRLVVPPSFDECWRKRKEKQKRSWHDEEGEREEGEGEEEREERSCSRWAAGDAVSPTDTTRAACCTKGNIHSPLGERERR